MKLLTKAITKTLPKIGATDGLSAEQKFLAVKFFNPGGAGTWYGIEFDGTDSFFGYVTGLGEDSLGYFSLAELESVRTRLGLKIERDLYWNGKTTLAALIAGRAS